VSAPKRKRGRPPIGGALKIRLTDEQREYLEDNFHGEPLAAAIRSLINERIDSGKGEVPELRLPGTPMTQTR
jgi:hypothetical protein